MNSTENLEILPVCIPGVPKGKYKHHPISRGQNPDFYRPDDLRDTGTAETLWLSIFEKMLVGMYWKLNRPVPYAFRTHDGTVRSLDAGCLKFLSNRSPPELKFNCDDLGFIDSVEPSEKLLDRYKALKPLLIKQLEPPSTLS